MPPNTPEQMPTPPPPLDGELRFDEVTRQGRGDDFGHIVHKMPEGVLLPGSADDVGRQRRLPPDPCGCHPTGARCAHHPSAFTPVSRSGPLIRGVASVLIARQGHRRTPSVSTWRISPMAPNSPEPPRRTQTPTTPRDAHPRAYGGSASDRKTRTASVVLTEQWWDYAPGLVVQMHLALSAAA
jgi:hypothetical protein